MKQSLREDWPNPTQVHLILAVLGSYYGYTAMDARESSLYSVHPLISSYVEEHPDIKFHLTTTFERELIEALYQHAFFPQKPAGVRSALFSTISVPQNSSPLSVPERLVSHSEYTVLDLLVQQYDITEIGRIVQSLNAGKQDTIDERSEVGSYLMSKCFFHAEEYELSMHAGTQKLHYRINRDKITELITDGKIPINLRMLQVALEEDAKGNAK
ncbi:MAG: hypothetical protein V1800_15245 [Candidatus Latescibacterota bacterium]